MGLNDSLGKLEGSMGSRRGTPECLPSCGCRGPRGTNVECEHAAKSIADPKKLESTAGPREHVSKAPDLGLPRNLKTPSETRSGAE
eukprot:6148421-Pyramimonas_sp.AAC.1